MIPFWWLCFEEDKARSASAQHPTLRLGKNSSEKLADAFTCEHLQLGCKLDLVAIHILRKLALNAMLHSESTVFIRMKQFNQ